MTVLPRYRLRYLDTGRYRDWAYPEADPKEVSLVAASVETLESDNHPAWWLQDDGGGLFRQYSERWWKTPSDEIFIRNTAGSLHTWTGKLVSGTRMGTEDDVSVAYAPYAWGPIAYDRMKPTKPMNNLFNMIIELRDLPGAILQLKDGFERSLSGIGDFYLSQMFGWMPLVNDFMTLIETQQKIQKRVEWLIRNNGKWIHRDVNLRDTSSRWDSDWVESYDAFERIFPSSFYHTVPQYRYSVVKKERVWATAQFKYFLPEPPPGVKLNKTVKSALNGFRGITAGQLYRAIPWTWLIDWCFGFARILDNTEDGVAERLAARRFYIMREETSQVLTESKGFFYGAADRKPILASCKATSEQIVKTRTTGLPFYPGNPNELSATQLSILGALGLSKFG